MDFRAIAQESLAISELHNGREKLDTDEIKGKKLTIEDFDLAGLDDGTVFAVFTFADKPGFFYNGGLVLTKMVREWVRVCGSIDAARENYRESKDKVSIKLSVGHPKGDKQKTLVNVEIL